MDNNPQLDIIEKQKKYVKKGPESYQNLPPKKRKQKLMWLGTI